MGDSIQMKFNDDKLVASLTKYTAQVRECIRPAAYAGASLLYDEMRRRVPVSKKGSVIRGKRYPPGLLRSSIYRKFVDRVVNADSATYHIGPNKKKAGHWAWIEFGHWTTTERNNRKKTAKRSSFAGPIRRKWVPAQPYIRPTWDGSSQSAVDQMRATLKKRLAEKRGGTK